MIKHVVMWSLHDATQAEQVKEALLALRGRIPGLIDLEVGIDFLRSPQSADVVLITTLESPEALEAYQQHPEHQAVIPLMKSVARSRTVVDYHI
jgi:hypothetical protein